MGLQPAVARVLTHMTDDSAGNVAILPPDRHETNAVLLRVFEVRSGRHLRPLFSVEWRQAERQLQSSSIRPN